MIARLWRQLRRASFDERMVLAIVTAVGAGLSSVTLMVVYHGDPPTWTSVIPGIALLLAVIITPFPPSFFAALAGAAVLTPVIAGLIVLGLGWVLAVPFAVAAPVVWFVWHFTELGTRK
jgi:hypothetical protein